MKYARLDYKSIVVTIIFCIIIGFVCFAIGRGIGTVNEESLQQAVEQHERSFEEGQEIFNRFRDGVQGVADGFSDVEYVFPKSEEGFANIFEYIKGMGNVYDTLESGMAELERLIRETEARTP